MIAFVFPVGHMQKGRPWFFKLQAIWSRRALRRLQDSSFIACIVCTALCLCVSVVTEQ